MLSQYSFKYKSIEFDLNFKNRFMIIGGDSGVGKSFIFQYMKKDAIVNKKSFLCINYEDVSGLNIDIKSKLLDTVNKIIVIDNAEIVLNMDLRSFVSLDERNQYIIFSHTISGFYPSDNSLAELIYGKNKVYLKYYV